MAVKKTYHIERIPNSPWEHGLKYPCAIKSNETIYWSSVIGHSASFKKEFDAVEAIEKYLPDGDYIIVTRITKTSDKNGN